MLVKRILLASLLCILSASLQGSEGNFRPISIDEFRDSIQHWDNKNPDDTQPRHEIHQIRLIADNILIYQRANGGWPENTNPLRKMTTQELSQQAVLHKATDTSFDNRNVYPQIRYLAEVYQQTQDDIYRQAVIRGLRFVLAMQLDNGGFTHSPPNTEHYYGHITIMDDVMSGVLGLLQEIKLGSARFDFLPADLVRELADAHHQGDELLLKLQVQINGEKTIWAGQYLADKLIPAQGRLFEPASLVSAESVSVVRYLMSDPRPSDRKIIAIKQAINWFEKNALTGIDMIQIKAEPIRFKYHTSEWDRVIVKDDSSPPIWARFYDLNTSEPLLVNRLGQQVATLADISRERRTGYNWYGRWPAQLLGKDFPAWQLAHSKSRVNTQ